MGYYTGNGVTTSKTADLQFLEKETVPAVIVDGRPTSYFTYYYTQKTKTSTKTKNGVAMPNDVDLAASDISYYNNGMIKTKKTKQVQRIGDSNLCTEVVTIVSNTIYQNGNPIT